MSDTSQVERQLYVLSLLSENRRGYTTEEILNSLHRIGIDISRKTVERDIDYITANFFIYEDERDGKTVYKANKYSIQHISFTISELISLYFAKEVIKSYSGLDVADTAVRIIDRLMATAPQINKSYLDSLSEMIKINVSDITPEKDLNPEDIGVIREAIAERKSLQLKYYSFNSDETTKRKFDPYLLEIQEGCWHIVGYCHLRKGVRDLRVSRIKALIKTKDSFERPENFYEQYKKDRFDKLAGEQKVKLRLRFTGNAARFIKEYEMSKADLIQEDGGSLMFERTTTMTPEIQKWILGFGAEVEVLEPQELKNEIRAHVQKLAEIYK